MRAIVLLIRRLHKYAVTVNILGYTIQCTITTYILFIALFKYFDSLKTEKFNPQTI